MRKIQPQQGDEVWDILLQVAEHINWQTEALQQILKNTTPVQPKVYTEEERREIDKQLYEAFRKSQCCGGHNGTI